MRISYPYGSKDRLSEMMQKVNGVSLTEGNEEILDFLKTVKADYPDNDDMYLKFLNLAKRKGIEIAKSEYENTYSPQTIKNRNKIDKKYQNTVNKLEKHNQIAYKYAGIIELIQKLIKTNGLYEMLLSIFANHKSRNVQNLILNKKYSNYFNKEIKDMSYFERRYLRYDRDLIPLESIELMEHKIKGWEKELSGGFPEDNFGLSLKIDSYLKAGVFMGKEINEDDFLYYKIILDPNWDDMIFMGSLGGNNPNKHGADLKFKKLENLAKEYNSKLLKPNELDIFLNKFIEIYDKPEKYYQEKVLSYVNENINNNKNIINEEVLPKNKRIKIIRTFIDFVKNKLGLDDKDMPEIIISYNDKEAKEMKSFGKNTPEINKIRIVDKNRNLADTLRTAGHEIKHTEQFIKGKLNPKSGDDGSEFENEANAFAGVVMREFGKLHPEIFE